MSCSFSSLDRRLFPCNESPLRIKIQAINPGMIIPSLIVAVIPYGDAQTSGNYLYVIGTKWRAARPALSENKVAAPQQQGSVSLQVV